MTVTSATAALVEQPPARTWESSLTAVRPGGRSSWMSLQNNPPRSVGQREPQGCLQETENPGVREILCEMLATSVWDGEHGDRGTGGEI